MKSGYWICLGDDFLWRHHWPNRSIDSVSILSCWSPSYTLFRTWSSAATKECFECQSLKSMEECVQAMKRVPCRKETDRCRNMTVQVYVRMLKENVTGFQRGCASQDECVFKRCTGHFGTRYGEEDRAYNVCKMSCCTGDLCPEGNVTSSSDIPIGHEKGARSGCDVIHPMKFSLAASISLLTASISLLSFIRTLLSWAIFQKKILLK